MRSAVNGAEVRGCIRITCMYLVVVACVAVLAYRYGMKGAVAGVLLAIGVLLLGTAGRLPC